MFELPPLSISPCSLQPDKRSSVERSQKNFEECIERAKRKSQFNRKFTFCFRISGIISAL